MSETGDAQSPHVATGCPFPAWSVAENSRVRHRVRAKMLDELYEAEM
jgi:hypothetical protein